MLFTKDKSACFKFENVITKPITSFIKNKFNNIETDEVDEDIIEIIKDLHNKNYNIYIYTFKKSREEIRRIHEFLFEANIPYLSLIVADNSKYHEDFLLELSKLQVTELYTDSLAFFGLYHNPLKIEINLVERFYNTEIGKMEIWSRERNRN